MGEHVEFGIDPYVSGADPYAAGAAAVDTVMGRHHHAAYMQPGHRQAAPFVGSATGHPFIYEAGLQSTPMQIGAATQGTLTKHANLPFRVIDWMVGNPTQVIGVATIENFAFTQILNGETPMMMGAGLIFGSSHGPQVWDRKVGYTTTQSGWDFVWTVTMTPALIAALGTVATIQYCYISFHYESHHRL